MVVLFSFHVLQQKHIHTYINVHSRADIYNNHRKYFSRFISFYYSVKLQKFTPKKQQHIHDISNNKQLTTDNLYNTLLNTQQLKLVAKANKTANNSMQKTVDMPQIIRCFRYINDSS